jgi:aspartate-semialdehyde dehydrogenase
LSEREPLKILGSVENGKIVQAVNPRISAHCTRVPVLYGHTACVSLGFSGVKPELREIQRIWTDFAAEPQKLRLPSAPELPIVYRQENDRPQPRLDRNADKAMRITVGRLRNCSLLDIRFTGLHHNTVRGAAGGCVLTAELLKARGLLE